MNNIAEIISISQNNIKKIFDIKAECENKNCIDGFVYANICKNCKRMVCNDCIINDRSKCVLCITNNEKNTTCKYCKKFKNIHMCWKCGKYLRGCGDKCKKNMLYSATLAYLKCYKCTWGYY